MILAAGAVSASSQEAKPKIAVVIDDFGVTYPKNPSDDLWMNIPWPVTFAVMPQSPRTKSAAEQTLKHGHELIIHFPFDPYLKLDLLKDRVSEGDVAKVRALLKKALSQIPGAVGLNNHRSLHATMNRPLMKAFMAEYKPIGRFFIDSHVSPQTVAYQEAQAAGIPSYRNFLFLEEGKVHTKPFCVKILRQAAGLARKRGEILVIGHHYFQGTFDCLSEEVPKLQAEGFEFVFASKLVR